MTKRAKVSRILRFSCVDGPGNRLVIFMQGCNFNCVSCHNPHTINHCNHCGDCVEHCPTHALTIDNDNHVSWDESLCTHCDNCINTCLHQSNPKISSYSVTELLSIIDKQCGFISGITVSGGEATLQLPFIIELFTQIKRNQQLKHLSCFVDSNGYLNQVGWQKLAPVLDGAMIDLKAWQNDTHQWLVGRDNHRVITSIRYLASLDKLHELRLLHIPGVTDLEDEVQAIAQLIGTFPKQVIIRLNAFQHHGVIGQALEWPKCNEAQIESLRAKLAQRISHTIITPSVYT